MRGGWDEEALVAAVEVGVIRGWGDRMVVR